MKYRPDFKAYLWHNGEKFLAKIFVVRISFRDSSFIELEEQPSPDMVFDADSFDIGDAIGISAERGRIKLFFADGTKTDGVAFERTSGSICEHFVVPYAFADRAKGGEYDIFGNRIENASSDAKAWLADRYLFGFENAAGGRIYHAAKYIGAKIETFEDIDDETHEGEDRSAYVGEASAYAGAAVGTIGTASYYKAPSVGASVS